MVFNPNGDLVARSLLIPDGCGGGQQEFIIVNDSMFTICTDEARESQFPGEYDILELDLQSGQIVNTWTQSMGFPGTSNISFVYFNGDLWVDSFDGVARIDLATGSVRGWESVLAVSTGVDVDLFVANGELWGRINSNAYTTGGLVRWIESSQSWYSYTLNTFPESESRMDMFDFFISNETGRLRFTYRNNNDQNILVEYNPATNNF